MLILLISGGNLKHIADFLSDFWFIGIYMSNIKNCSIYSKIIIATRFCSKLEAGLGSVDSSLGLVDSSLGLINKPSLRKILSLFKQLN